MFVQSSNSIEIPLVGRLSGGIRIDSGVWDKASDWLTQSCQVTLDISGSPINFQWGSWKYPG